MKDYRDLTIKARVTNKQIKVETVVLDTGMNAEQFRSFMSDLADALRIADNKKYGEYEEAKAELENAETKDDIHNAEWHKNRAYEQWDIYSNLWRWASEMAEFGKEDDGTEGGEND
jgi:hypothetical protein